jgi:hypothetical protein
MVIVTAQSLSPLLPLKVIVLVIVLDLWALPAEADGAQRKP